MEKTDPDPIPVRISVHPIEDAVHLRVIWTAQKGEATLDLLRLGLLVSKLGQKGYVSFSTTVSATRWPKIAP